MSHHHFDGQSPQCGRKQQVAPSKRRAAIADRLWHRMRPVPTWHQSSIAVWLVLWLASGAAIAQPQIVTVAGTGHDSISPLAGPTETNLGNPFGVEWGAAGDLFICEVSHHRVWRLNLGEQRLTVVAGTGQRGYAGDGGLATDALLNEPYECRFDRQGNLYFVEMQNHVVRRVDQQSGKISTVAGTGVAGYGGDGGPAVQAQLKQPHSIALDDHGNLYIADIGNHRIRRVRLNDGVIESFAGNGEKRLPQDGQVAKDHPVLGPRTLFITQGTLWVGLREGHSVWKIELNEGRWIHVAGTGKQGYTGDGGPAKEATFNGPKGIALDAQGNVYIADTENQVIRHIDRVSGVITTLAGAGPNQRGYGGDQGPAVLAKLNRPHGVCVTADGQRVAIGDSENHRVREVIVLP